MNKSIFKVFLVVFLIGNLSFVQGQCLPGRNIFSQTDIDNFSIDYPGCTEISGDVILLSNIVNLHGFSQLESVGGLFMIYGTQIENLNGLENLSFVDALDLNDNRNLQNIHSLANLTSVNNLGIWNNPLLSSLSSLEKITTIQRELAISGESLISLDGLQNLISTGRGVTIANIPLIENLNGLEGLVSIGGDLSVYQNYSLKNLGGLENLTTVGRNILIGGNPQFSTYSHLINLNSVGENFSILSHSLVENLNGLENLTHVGERLNISGNDILNNIDGLKNIDGANMTELWIQVNPMLSECAIQSICDYLAINPANTNIVQNASGCSTRQEVEDACDLINVEENQLSELKIYPNPTNDTFNISGLKDGNIQIMDSQGRVVKEMNLEEGAYSISELTAGVYFVKITSNTASVTKQIIKK